MKIKILERENTGPNPPQHLLVHKTLPSQARAVCIISQYTLNPHDQTFPSNTEKGLFGKTSLMVAQGTLCP